MFILPCTFLKHPTTQPVLCCNVVRQILALQSEVATYLALVAMDQQWVVFWVHNNLKRFPHVTRDNSNFAFVRRDRYNMLCDVVLFNEVLVLGRHLRLDESAGKCQQC